MPIEGDLVQFLERWSAPDPKRGEVAQTIEVIARAALALHGLVDRGELAGGHDVVGFKPAGGDQQTGLDRQANALLLDALRDAPVAAMLSEEAARPIAIRADQPLVAAIDPLDGTTNIDTNAAIGTIFSVLPRFHDAECNGVEDCCFLQPGTHQLAAGFVVHGSSTLMALSVCEGTHVFTFDPDSGRFLLTLRNVQIPDMAREYAINASNYRHWDEAIRIYVDDCLQGIEGVRGCDFNMRWIGSLVAEIYRIFMRGGIYIYPADQREGYEHGRLRLIYEANPIALLAEQAGGAASTGRERILDIVPKSLHQRVPILVGSRAEVDYVDRLYTHPRAHGERSPLFGRRGLFRL